MLLYRIFGYDRNAPTNSPGHPEYLHRPAQGTGRIDNPDKYVAWYLAREATGAVAEVFGNQTTWQDGMFDFPYLAGARKALGIYHLPDDLPVLNLDHALALHQRGLRPTQIVERNRSASQQWARDVYEERNVRGEPKWAGVEWWSYHRPHWRMLGLWQVTPECVQVDALDLKHHAVVDAARSLGRVI